VRRDFTVMKKKKIDYENEKGGEGKTENSRH